ncbi:MAG TPA: hypothetical protein VFQ75_14600 [Candidatus Limnocylindrales bacterium]|jgi:hypothetical protein|nr:hypothetical protein [Candidatus Limnocylindrales bacterium]
MDLRPYSYRRGEDLIAEWHREAADSRLALASDDTRDALADRAIEQQEGRLGRAASAVRHPLHALQASLHPQHRSRAAH